MKHGTIGAIDSVIRRIARWFSYLGGIAILLMAFMAFINILSSKVFGKAIANVNELIDYMLIAVVYCCAAHCQVGGGGLVQVDIFYRKFPETVKKIVLIAANVFGMFVYAFAGYQAFSLLEKHFTLKTLASSSLNSFQIWPFTLLYIVGSLFLSLALLWSIFTMFLLPDKSDQEVAADEPEAGEEEQV